MLVGLVLYAVATICSPGAANLLAADGGARVGVRRAAGLLTGITLTVLLVVALCAAGLGQLVASLPSVRLALRLLGSAYLLWLAVRIARAHPPSSGSGGAVPGFGAGVASTIVNPKTWTVGIGAAASFSDLAPDPLTFAAITAGAFAVVVVPNLLIWAWLGSWISRRLSSGRAWRVFSAALAVLLVVSVVTLWVE